MLSSHEKAKLGELENKRRNQVVLGSARVRRAGGYGGGLCLLAAVNDACDQRGA